MVNNMEQTIKVGDVITLNIKRMGINGEGIGYHEKLAVFVEHALPGETVEARVSEVYDNRALAELTDIIKQSKDRIDPFCPVYDACGGCQTQHYDYDAMLKQKRDILLKSFDRYIGKNDYDKITETIGMENPLNYRNKASLPVRMIDGKNRFGMFARNSNRFIPIDECGIQHDMVNAILNTIIELMDDYQLDAYDFINNTGYILSLVVRVSENLNEAQVSFITSQACPNLKALTHHLVVKHPEIVSVYEVINSDKRQAFFIENAHMLYGKATINEELGGYQFELKPESFFQLNVTQADKFYKIMKEQASLSQDSVVVDVYSGINPVSHYMRKKVKKIYAVPLEKNQTINELSFSKNTIEHIKHFKDFDVNNHEIVDVMFYDPTRQGLTQQGIDFVLSVKPKKLIYGSSNPSTLAKDLSQLLKEYEIIQVVPIDMFPYTSLVESISMLELKELNKAGENK